MITSMFLGFGMPVGGFGRTGTGCFLGVAFGFGFGRILDTAFDVEGSGFGSGAGPAFGVSGFVKSSGSPATA
jgi:hypothetical protein